MPLTADDGTLLKAKEGVVLDKDGQPLTSSGRIQGRSFTLPVPGIIAAAIILPVVLAVGIAFIGGFGVLLAVLFAVSALARFIKRI